MPAETSCFAVVYAFAFRDPSADARDDKRGRMARAAAVNSLLVERIFCEFNQGVIPRAREV